MVDEDKGSLGAKVFFIWGSLCACCFVYSYLLIPETKGLTLEQVDQMLAETVPRTSSRWVPHTTYTAAAGIGGREKRRVGRGREPDPSNRV